MKREPRVYLNDILEALRRLKVTLKGLILTSTLEMQRQ